MPLPDLPDEIITEILTRLPVRSVLRFRCVCKQWRFSIATPRFIREHLRKSSSSSSSQHCRIMMRFARGSFEFKSISVYDPCEATTVVGSDRPWSDWSGRATIQGCCDGLILLTTERWGLQGVHIWNPSTREYKSLPSLHLIGAGSRATVCFGFGYDSSIDDFKVFAIRDTDRFNEVQVSVYTLFRSTSTIESESESWRRIEDFPYHMTGDSGKLVNGALHWPTIAPSASSWSIVSLDLAKETYSEVPKPPIHEKEENGEFVGLEVLGGCICGIYNFFKTRFDVWVMKEYGVADSWTKLVTIPYIQSMNTLKPILFLRNGNGEIMFFKYNYSMAVYNPKENTFTFLEIGDMPKFRQAYPYFETLISPNAPSVSA